MNLRSISDQTLIHATEKLVSEEREVLTKVLRHLCEIERRRLFSALGYKSLFDFAIHKLRYSNAQAYRRIIAMRMVKEVPLIEEKINDGELTLSHLGLAHAHFQNEKKLNQQELKFSEKMEVIRKISSKTSREAEKIIFSLSSSPQQLRPDSFHQLDEKHIEIKFSATNSLQTKIEQLKGLLAHKFPNIRMNELFEKLCDLGLQEWNPAKNISHRDTPGKAFKKMPQKTRSKAYKKTYSEIFEKADHKCENCKSEYALEIDHIQPKALGGTNDEGNLRLLCRNCNQRAAIEIFGADKMEKYL